VLPPALLWGASFPLALAAAATEGQDPGKLVGGVYAANTVGAIFGALSASMLLIVWIGSQHAQQVLMAISTAAGLLVLIPSKGMKGPMPERGWVGAIMLLVATGIAALLAGRVPPVPRILIAYGRYAATWVGQNDIFYAGEGRESSVAVSRTSAGALNYHNAGKVQASSEPQDMRLQRMLGHLTTLIPQNAKSVLVIGCGAGVTAGAVSISPRVERVTIAEIEPLVPQVVSTYFGNENYNVVKNPKVRVQYDDARHFLLTTKEKFDAITSDPFDPWVRGAANLYTEEFFNAAKARLNPGGVVTVFVQLYESNLEAVKSEVATFMKAFPNGIVWGNTKDGAGYDMVLSGQVEPTKIDLDEMERRFAQPEYAQMAQSLRELGFNSAADLFGTYAGRGRDLGEWFKDAQINRDRNLRLQYLAGMGLNLYQSGSIYADLLVHRKIPDDLYTGSDALVQNVKAAIQRPGL
jgi:spermidine synthase